MRFEILDGQTVINTINADLAFMQQAFPDGNYREVPEPEVPTPEPVPEPRHITVGAFFDRFGAAKLSLLASPDLTVQALIKDASVRKFIDLDRPDLLQALQLVQSLGFAIDAEQIVNAPIQPSERP